MSNVINLRPATTINAEFRGDVYFIMNATTPNAAEESARHHKSAFPKATFSVSQLAAGRSYSDFTQAYQAYQPKRRRA